MECNSRAKELFPPYCLSENWKIGIYYIFLFNHSHCWFIGKDTTFVHLSQPHSSSVNSNYLLSMLASFTCLIPVHTYKARMPPKKYKKLFNDYPSKKSDTRGKPGTVFRNKDENKTHLFFRFQSINLNYWTIFLRSTEVPRRAWKWVLDFWVCVPRGEKKKKS